MNAILLKVFKSARRMLWAVIVAFMLGIHNFYKGEDKTPDDFGIKTELVEKQESGAPKD